uniref:Inward rectifier potassium channel 4 n=2 Tax=Lygus hesperus TaxID=30085 RepID=A0A146KNK6_LYGHE
MGDKETTYISFKHSDGSSFFNNATNIDEIVDHYNASHHEHPEDIGLIQNGNSRSNNYYPQNTTPLRQRFVTREGKCAVRKSNRFEFVSTGVYYMTDIVSTLLECRWRYILMWYTLLNLVSWYLFGILWWIIAYAHDDLFTSPNLDMAREPCVTEVRNMINAFMFSVETQYTTGYGSRTPSTACPEAVFLLCVQNIIGMLLQSCSLGIIYAKLARPKARSQAIKFSEKSVISMRDGYLCLMFRIADMRKSHVIGCEVKGWVLRNKWTAEGELLTEYRSRLTLSIDDGGSDTFLVWPVTVVHKIDQNSPLYDLAAEELFSADFEIVTSLVCTIESTGQQVEVRRSYVPLEILWGHRFKNIIRKTRDRVHIDYSRFDRTVPVDTALCSAKSLQLCRWPSSSKFGMFLERSAELRTEYFATERGLLSVSRQVSKDEGPTSPEEELLSAMSSIS